jgi:hypothetical protein
MGNTIIYQEEWATKLQERLDYPTIWKDICNVEYTNERVLHRPYMTDATAAAHTRGSVYTIQDVTITDSYVTINASSIVPQMIDRADLAQTVFASQMVLADRQGRLLNEKIESYLYGLHASYTNFGDLTTSLGLGATAITVSATNIDDVIRGIKREISKANGDKLLEQNGGFIVWRPADFELLEAFMQANGFQTADTALKGGAGSGVEYMGLTHYKSNLLTASHVFAGVKKLMHLGIVKDTYGQIVVNQDPAGVSGGQFSAISIVSRVDYVGKVWDNFLPLLFDVNVA